MKTVVVPAATQRREGRRGEAAAPREVGPPIGSGACESSVPPVRIDARARAALIASSPCGCGGGCGGCGGWCWVVGVARAV